MPNFKGDTGILLQPSDRNVTYSFSFPIMSSATSNDGFCPYGTTISGVVVTAAQDGVAVDDLVDTTTNTTYTVNVTLDYPTTTMSGQTEAQFDLTFVLTLDNGTILETDFDRVKAQDL